jgi:hypothetical protein
MFVGLMCAIKEKMGKKDFVVSYFGTGLSQSMIKGGWLQNEAMVLLCSLGGMEQALHLCISTNLFMDALRWRPPIPSISR